jgi:hypothetical protein
MLLLGGEKGNVRWRQWLGILAAALLISESAFAQSRLALVIGNSNYQTAVRRPNSNPTRANGWRKRSYRTPPARAWRPLLSSRCRSAFTRTRPRSFAKGRASSHPVAQLGAAGTLFGAETGLVCPVFALCVATGGQVSTKSSRTQRSRDASKRPIHKKRIRKRGGRLGRALRTSGAHRQGEVFRMRPRK